MAATRRGRPVGPGRIDEAKVDALTEDDTRRFLIEDGLDPDNPLAGFRRIPSPVEVRRQTELSQDKFAAKLGVPVKTIRNWEQGVSTPDPAARALLSLVAADPGMMFRLLERGMPTQNEAVAVRAADLDSTLDRIVEKTRSVG